MKKADFGVSFLMFFVGIAALVRAWSYPAQTKMMPIIYSVALIILSFLLGVRSIRKEKSSEENVVQTEEPLSRVFFVGGIIFAYIASIEILGFYSSTILFLFLFMFLMRAASWLVTTLVSVGTTVVIYFFFETLLNIPIPKGIFF
ncbi:MULTISPECIES: tripartite tricarboxylate transporter TctB family protein [Aminobacterium]|uniref:tripartite tricarboxylate transporter TctB family protein n=1 Tax=Aminobacterium TaxID=81466 RepID=UPI00257D1879|nr:tripartite tricarboxylate transporter TctB family protein [Aminobacterium sp. UBA4987]